MISSPATTEYFSKVFFLTLINLVVGLFIRMRTPVSLLSQECACSWITVRSSDNCARSRERRAHLVPTIACCNHLAAQLRACPRTGSLGRYRGSTHHCRLARGSGVRPSAVPSQLQHGRTASAAARSVQRRARPSLVSRRRCGAGRRQRMRTRGAERARRSVMKVKGCRRASTPPSVPMLPRSADAAAVGEGGGMQRPLR